MGRSRTIGFRVDEETYRLWRSMQPSVKRSIRSILIAMVRNNGALPVTIEKKNYIIVSRGRMLRVRRVLEEMLRKHEVGMLHPLPKWALDDIKKALEVIG